MRRLTRDGTAEPVLRDQILTRERGKGNVHFPCSPDHEQNWQPYPVDPYSCYRWWPYMGSMCVCVCVFIKLHITAQSGPVILLIVILCHSHWSSQGGINDILIYESLWSDATISGSAAPEQTLSCLTFFFSFHLSLPRFPHGVYYPCAVSYASSPLYACVCVCLLICK